MDVVEVGRNYGVGWGTLALINAGLAQSKGKSRVTWFVISLLLGPVATFLIVIAESPRSPAGNGSAG